MINHGEDIFTMELTSVYTLTDNEQYDCAIGRVPMDSATDTEDPFVMGRTLLVLAVVELIIGLGVYRYFFS